MFTKKNVNEVVHITILADMENLFNDRLTLVKDELKELIRPWLLKNLDVYDESGEGAEKLQKLSEELEAKFTPDYCNKLMGFMAQVH